MKLGKSGEPRMELTFLKGTGRHWKSWVEATPPENTRVAAPRTTPSDTKVLLKITIRPHTGHSTPVLRINLTPYHSHPFLSLSIQYSSNMSAFEAANKDLDYDVLIVGAGLSGLYTLHRIRQLGLRVKVLEAGEAEGGTWFW